MHVFILPQYSKYRLSSHTKCKAEPQSGHKLSVRKALLWGSAALDIWNGWPKMT